MTRRQKIDAINMKMLERGELAQSLTFASDNYIDSIYNELFDGNTHVIYHGSSVIVEKPEVRIARKTKDFGQGFYCTSIESQAARWATRRKDGVVSAYKYSANQSLRFLSFPKMTEEWLDFIIRCRLERVHEYDIVEGPMADDEVFLSVQDYMSGEISRAAFWELIKFRYPTHQISFHTAAALETLVYLGHEVIKR